MNLLKTILIDINSQRKWRQWEEKIRLREGDLFELARMEKCLINLSLDDAKTEELISQIRNSEKALALGQAYLSDVHNNLVPKDEWGERLLYRNLANAEEWNENPNAWLVCGQPGSGKEAIFESLRITMAQENNGVIVNTGELMYFHPMFNKDAVVDGVPDSIIEDCCQISEEIIFEALSNSTDLLFNLTLLDADAGLELIQTLHDHQYKIGMVIVCTPPAVSRTHLDELQKVWPLPSPIFSETLHDAVFEFFPDTLEKLQSQNLINEICILSESAGVLYDSSEDGETELSKWSEIVQKNWQSDDQHESPNSEESTADNKIQWRQNLKNKMRSKL